MDLTASLHNAEQKVNTTEIDNDSNSANFITLTQYQQELKKSLPAEIFLRNPMNLLYLFLFGALSLSIIFAILYLDIAWYWKFLAALVLGQSNAGLTFLAHDTLHGSVVKNHTLQNIIGGIGFAPFLVSPTYWRFWHNNLHHGNTQLIFKDPDAFPTLSVYKRSKFMQRIFELTPGSKNPLSYLYFFYWFSFQAVWNQARNRFGNKMWSAMDHKKVTMEFSLLCILAAGYFYWIGVANILWLVVIPLAVQNYTILSYILTNHNISPLTKINDPLENSLTVTNHPILDFFHLNFGYHVEHHIFPRVSSRHAKKIHEVLKSQYPQKFKVMPKWKALRYLYKTSRIYNNSNELIHPKTKQTYPTI